MNPAKTCARKHTGRRHGDPSSFSEADRKEYEAYKARIASQAETEPSAAPKAKAGPKRGPKKTGKDAALAEATGGESEH